MQITNLRLVYLASSSHTNISIGYGTITSLALKSKESRLSGRGNALYITARGSCKSKYQFVFGNTMDASSTRLFKNIQVQV
jgi:hypothetical protein